MTDLQTSLKKCRIDGNTLFLPSITDGALPNYNEVKAALLKAGAKYQRNTFVFPSAAQPFVDRLMGGEKVNIKKQFQFFATPSSLADRLVKKASIKKHHSILEPSAGQGAIIDAIVRKLPGMTVDNCELMDQNLIQLMIKHPTSKVLCKDFFELPVGDPLYIYDRIIANPPFSKNQDIDHIRKMYDHLVPGGRLVSIASQSWQNGSQKKQVEFSKWLAEIGAEIEFVEPGVFKESGTSVGGFIITIDKK